MLEPLDLRNEAAVVLDPRVPALVARIELADLVPALGEPDGLRRVGRDAVLVPGDVPGDGHDELAADSRERDHAGARLAEALGDSADRAPVVARVEDVGRLDDGELAFGEAAQGRLGRDRLVDLRAGREQ